METENANDRNLMIANGIFLVSLAITSWFVVVPLIVGKGLGISLALLAIYFFSAIFKP